MMIDRPITECGPISLTMRSSKCTLHTPASSASMFPVTYTKKQKQKTRREQSVFLWRLATCSSRPSSERHQRSRCAPPVNRNNAAYLIYPALGARTTIGVPEPAPEGFAPAGHGRDTAGTYGLPLYSSSKQHSHGAPSVREAHM